VIQRQADPGLVRAAALPLGAFLLAVALAGLARHRLVEPAGLTATCDAAPWDGLACILRTLTVQSFAAHRLGSFALGAALVATVARWRLAALAALVAGGAGLVLYSTPLAAPAVLLAALVLARPAGAQR
jgi:hypothetical protein